MRLGLIGLGKMGSGMKRRVEKAGHEVVGFDQKQAAEAESLDDLVAKVTAPRVVWIMIPAGKPIDDTLDQLNGQLEAGDVVIDGGNSFYKDSVRRGQDLIKRGVEYIDAGVSGGVAGEDVGYAVMAGGSEEAVALAQPIFDALVADKAFAHVGELGSGHFVKMVHNAIEYGMMQAMAEGFGLIKDGPFKDLDLAQISEMWNHGTIIRSFLMQLTAQALKKDSNLKKIAAYVDDSGEGRWSVNEAVEHGVPFWVNTAALYARFDSRQEDLFAHKLLSALRNEFGGHAVKEQ